MGALKIASAALPAGEHRVPDAARHFSRCFAEPGPYQALVFVTAPALQRPGTIPAWLQRHASDIDDLKSD
jgi:hypothetical protein